MRRISDIVDDYSSWNSAAKQRIEQSAPNNSISRQLPFPQGLNPFHSSFLDPTCNLSQYNQLLAFAPFSQPGNMFIEWSPPFFDPYPNCFHSTITHGCLEYPYRGQGVPFAPTFQYYVNSRREPSDNELPVEENKEEQGGPGVSYDAPLNLNLLENLIPVRNSLM